MKKKLKLKPFVLPTIFTVVAITLILSAFLMTNKLQKDDEKENITYVSSIILNNDIPVISTDTMIKRPYTDTKVTTTKFFYDYQSEKERQENSIIYHENTYMQNTGIDFIGTEPFEVMAILDGTVINIKDDELLGKTIEIRHNNDLISIYQSLSEVTVKKDDTVSQGQVLGKSGENTLDQSLKNHLHFELFDRGQVVNPENYFDKKLKEIRQ